ncbi:hypothetical protein TanjilG_24067 [Lupinus angustifolius]|uniref:Uncharacterized protein n=1 Tax=Lupinus angustifolius TaxID=3871 RepID=A0A1J7GQ25_LUPAN|nr:PREDICTED: uncharacterized protein At1g65710-like [Lupinus angustifolius]OIW02616.1 hypothetical protein TanjilG_24067 [Lupinus angustifolius]
MGTCLSKKKDSSTPSPVAGSKSVSTAPSQLNYSGNGVSVTQPKVNLEERKTVQEKQKDQLAQQGDEGQVKKEIFIIKHRKSHDDNNRERNSKIPPFTSQSNVQPQQNVGSPSASGSASTSSSTIEAAEKSSMGTNNKIAPSTPNMGVVRTSSCTKEEVDAILIQCGRLSRSSSGRAASSSGGKKYSGSKRSFDFDNCDNNETVSADGDLKRTNDEEHGDGKSHHQHRQRHRQSPKKRGSSPSSQGRRRTPSREREQQQQQRSSSRERRVSRSPGRRSSETNANNNNNNTSSSRPGKMVSVPATVTSLVMDKSNNGVGFGESTGIKRVTVMRNVGDGSRSAASPRSQSPARANGNAAANANQQQPSLGRNNSGKKAEHSPYRRNPLSEIDPNSLAYPQSNTNNSSNKLQNNAKREVEANQKPNADNNDNKNRNNSRVAMEKGVGANYKAKEQKEEIKALSTMIDNVVVKNVIPSDVVDNLKQQPQTLARSRSSRRSRDLDLNPESLLNPTQTYTSLLLEDIQNFHQKTTQQQQPSISLPACLTKACSILEAVADLNSTTSSNFSDDRRSPPTCQSVRNNNERNHYGKRVQLPGTKDHPFVESEIVVNDDVMEPSLHKYVTVKRGGSLGVSVDMEDQESSGSNSFTVTSNGQNHWSNISSSWEPSSADSKDCWTSRLDSTEELESGIDMKTLSSKRRECDHQHSNGIGRGRLGSKGVVIAAAST